MVDGRAVVARMTVDACVVVARKTVTGCVVVAETTATGCVVVARRTVTRFVVVARRTVTECGSTSRAWAGRRLKRWLVLSRTLASFSCVSRRSTSSVQAADQVSPSCGSGQSELQIRSVQFDVSLDCISCVDSSRNSRFAVLPEAKS